MKNNVAYHYKVMGVAPSEEQWRMEFKAVGLVIKQPPSSDVEVSIDRVYAAHNAGRVKVFDDLEAYFDEKATYARVLDESGEPTDQIENKGEYHNITLCAVVSLTMGSG